jgi:predicted MFS family arabinose efflux permease
MTDVAAGPLPGQPASVRYSDGYKRMVLWLLVAVYTFNFIDRTVINTIGPAIQEDLKISNAELGLLIGFYFALLYTLLGVPIARLAERFSRVNIIAISLAVWSGFTVLCGLATNYVMLALFRFGVGIGEAGCSPPAHSLISDYFEPRKRASALAVYAFGIPIGSMFGAAAGGWLAQDLGWRVAFIVVGLPGVLLAVAFKLLVKEPPRGWADEEARREAGLPAVAQPPAPPFSFGAELKEMWAVTKVLFAKWPVLHMVLGVTVCSFGGYGIGAFAAPYFRTTYGLDLATVGLLTGLLAGVSNGIGTLVGGFISDRLSRRSPAWYALTPAFGLALCVPLYLIAYLQADWRIAAAILLLPGIFHYTYLGPTFGVVQNSVDIRRRATAVAIMFLFLNLIALGFGPPFTGWVADQVAQTAYATPALGDAFGPISAWLGGGAPAGAASFEAACPGGRAPEGAVETAVEACRAAQAAGLRGGIIVTLITYLWASLHYFLAAKGMARHMAERAAIQAKG